VIWQGFRELRPPSLQGLQRHCTQINQTARTTFRLGFADRDGCFDQVDMAPAQQAQFLRPQTAVTLDSTAGYKARLTLALQAVNKRRTSSSLSSRPTSDRSFNMWTSSEMFCLNFALPNTRRISPIFDIDTSRAGLLIQAGALIPGNMRSADLAQHELAEVRLQMSPALPRRPSSSERRSQRTLSDNRMLTRRHYDGERP
jgi:hypothetical protein